MNSLRTVRGKIVVFIIIIIIIYLFIFFSFHCIKRIDPRLPSISWVNRSQKTSKYGLRLVCHFFCSYRILTSSYHINHNIMYLFCFLSGGFYSDDVGYVSTSCKKCPNGSFVALDEAPGKQVQDCKTCPLGRWTLDNQYLSIQFSLSLLGGTVRKKSRVQKSVSFIVVLIDTCSS